VSDVFSYVNELANMPDWLAGVVERVENERCTHQTIGMLSTNWTSKVEAREGVTKVTIEVEYTLPGLVIGRLAEHLTVRRMTRDLESSLLNLKEIIEGK